MGKKPSAKAVSFLTSLLLKLFSLRLGATISGSLTTYNPINLPVSRTNTSLAFSSPESQDSYLLAFVNMFNNDLAFFSLATQKIQENYTLSRRRYFSKS